jgi:hypothetical protein
LSASKMQASRIRRTPAARSRAIRMRARLGNAR